MLLALGVAVVTFVRLSQDSEPAPQAIDTRGAAAAEPLVVVFVDSLAEDLVRDRRVMPALAALADRGVTLGVEPCRDRLTYLCLRAALTGRDEATLASLYRNFDGATPIEEPHLFADAATSGLGIVAVGTQDLGPYRAAFRAQDLLPGGASERDLVARLGALERDGSAAVSVVSFGSGDKVAHAFGPGSAEYTEAFAIIDRQIGQLARRTAQGVNVVVFGDHGHDERGRHLPGGPARTAAVYAGPAFREGVRGEARLADHRVLLGLALGLNVPDAYAGPKLEQIFRASWLERHHPRGTPHLARVAARERPGVGPFEATGLIMLALLALTASLRNLRLWSGRGLLRVAVTASALSLVSGMAYDAIRLVIHDHGYTPWRSAWLALPLGAGFAWAARRRSARSGVLLAGAAVSFAVCLWLLFPTAYYYGSARAVVYASMLGAAAIAATAVLKRGRHAPRAALVGLGFVILCLTTFTNFSSTGDDLAGRSTFVVSASAFRQHAIATALIAKLALWLMLAVGRGSTALDRVGSAIVVVLSLGAQAVGAGAMGSLVVAPTAFLAIAALGLALSWVAREHLPATRWLSLVVVLGHFHPSLALQIAPIELILAAAAVALWAIDAALEGTAARRLANAGVLVASAVLLLWPSVGLRLSGLDFRFMFQWVAAADYERLWWLIGLGTLLKLAWPLWLLAGLAKLFGVGAGRDVGAILGVKLALLSCFVVGYATRHPMGSRLALEMLTELALLTATLALLLPALAPWRLRVPSTSRRAAGDVGPRRTRPAPAR